MKIPEAQPKFAELVKSKLKDIMEASVDPEVVAFLAKEEIDYNYWDKFQHLQMPKNIPANIIWACRELRRLGKTIISPIKNGSSDNFVYALTPLIEQTLHQADRNMPFLTDDLSREADREAVLIRSLMEEAIASSQIEGAAATRSKAKAMLATNKKPANRAEQMILNNYKAITHIRDIKAETLSEEMLLELHRTLCEKTLDAEEIGRFRKSPNDDDVEVIDSDGVVLYRPPPGAAIGPMLKDLINFANTDDGPFMHPLIKGILLHFWFAWIHPFCDGNGRTARAIFYWYMLKKKYWAFEYLSISRIVLNKEGQYKRAFLNTELSGDLTYFLLFNSKIINEAAEEVSNYIKRKLKQEHDNIGLLTKFPALNRRQREIIAHARNHGAQVYTIRRHQIQNNLSYATARADILGLVAAGMFMATGKSKTHEFLPILEKMK